MEETLSCCVKQCLHLLVMTNVLKRLLHTRQEESHTGFVLLGINIINQPQSDPAVTDHLSSVQLTLKINVNKHLHWKFSSVSE